MRLNVVTGIAADGLILKVVSVLRFGPLLTAAPLSLSPPHSPHRCCSVTAATVLSDGPAGQSQEDIQEGGALLRESVLS